MMIIVDIVALALLFGLFLFTALLPDVKGMGAQQFIFRERGEMEKFDWPKFFALVFVGLLTVLLAVLMIWAIVVVIKEI